MEYCFDRGFNILLLRRIDWTSDTTVPLELLDVYTEGFKLESGVGNGVYFGKLNLNILLWLPDYCSVFQAEVMIIYRTAQWIFTYGVPFTHIPIVFDSQAAIKSLSNIPNNS